MKKEKGKKNKKKDYVRKDANGRKKNLKTKDESIA